MNLHALTPRVFIPLRSPNISVKKFLAIILILHSAFLFSIGNPNVDSLETLLNATNSDTQRVEILTALSKYYSRNEHEKANANAREALALSENISYTPGIISANYYLALIHQYEGQYKDALEKFLAALTLSENFGSDSLTIQIYNSIANNFSLQERREEGLNYYEKALQMARDKKMKKAEATILGNMGNVFYYKSYDYEKGTWDTSGLMKTLYYYTESVKLHSERNDTAEMISPMMNIALVQTELGKTADALKILTELKVISEKRNDISQLVYIESNTAQAYLVSENFPEAMAHFNEAINYGTTVKDYNAIMGIYAMIAQHYAEQKNFENAYINYVKYSELRDSLITEENSNSVSEMQTKYETEKKEKQIVNQMHELNKKQIFVYAASFGLFLMILLALVIFRGYKQKQKSNEIITQQKILVEEKNKNITDSILYASRIQGAILPEQELFRGMFPDSFIFYRPRDIVSGDFYWFSEKEEHKLLAVADCTGHGVPGAMMSMVGSSLLHQIVNEKTINNPSVVLTELDKQIIRSLKQKGAEGESREGMDISFIDINKKNNLLRFSGANRPLYILRDGKLEEAGGSKYPIGSITRNEKIFEVKEIQLQKGDCIYLTTDGISDQFGEKTNKKFMTRRFRESLVSICQQPMQKQREALINIIDTWKGSMEQIDDICVVGIRI